MIFFCTAIGFLLKLNKYFFKGRKNILSYDHLILEGGGYDDAFAFDAGPRCSEGRRRPCHRVNNNQLTKIKEFICFIEWIKNLKHSFFNVF